MHLSLDEGRVERAPHVLSDHVGEHAHAASVGVDADVTDVARGLRGGRELGAASVSLDRGVPAAEGGRFGAPCASARAIAWSRSCVSVETRLLATSSCVFASSRFFFMSAICFWAS